MQFQEFQSLVNENPKNSGKILLDDRAKAAMCYVTEKIHGANFGIWYNHKTTELRFSKRTSFIGEDANFFNWQRYFTQEKKEAIKLKMAAHCLANNCETITLYGELFGGDGAQGIKSVQKEIRYGNDITFIGFQLIVDGVFIVKYESLADFCDKIGVPVVPKLDEGLLTEVYARINPDMPSVLSPEGDIREGVVITVFDFPGMEEGQPLMMKVRSKDFIENKGVVNKARKDFDANLSAEILQIVNVLREMCTMQRVSNVNSHYGYEGGANFSNLMTAVAQDVLKEYTNTYGDVSKEVLTQAKKVIGRVIPPMVRTELGL